MPKSEEVRDKKNPGVGKPPKPKMLSYYDLATIASFAIHSIPAGFAWEIHPQPG